MKNKLLMIEKLTRCIHWLERANIPLAEIRELLEIDLELKGLDAEARFRFITRAIIASMTTH